MTGVHHDRGLWVPYPSPSMPPNKLVVALVAWLAEHSPHGRPEGEVSRRWLALNLCRTDDKAASRLLTVLRTPDEDGDRWISLSLPGEGLRANRYTLGSKALQNRLGWVALGERLFGSKGYLRPFLRRGVIRHRELNISGCLLLGYLMVNGPSTRDEIYRSLEEFLHKPTLRSARARALDGGLIQQDGDEFALVPGFYAALDAYEHERNLDTWLIRKEEVHKAQRDRYAKDLRGHTYLEDFKKGLRDLACTYCRKVPEKRGGGTVEHFPPVHWGGSDRYSLLLPACAKCNGDDSPKIKRTPRLDTPFPGEIRLEMRGDPAEFLLGLMYREHERYAIEMASGRPDNARERVVEQFPLWVAHRDEMTLHVDETLDDNSFVGFTRLDLNDPDYLDHIRQVRTTVDACRS